MKLTEFYPELQGRPDSKVSLDMETRRPHIPAGLISGVMLQASYSTIELTANYDAADNTVILVDTRSTTVTVTLPEASVSSGRFYIIKKIDSAGGEVFVEGYNPVETIDGETSVKLSLQYQYVTVLCDGTVWHIIGGEYVKMEDLLDTLLNEVIDNTRKILIEAQQQTLHLASQSDEPIDEESLDA